MVTVRKRPEGYKIIDQGISATVTTIGDGDAIINFTAHGLITGDVVYVESDIDEYNGFWYVTLINANSFKISDWSDDQVDYFQDADITYYQTQPHDWSSIFLPMVYKATNDRWPVNTVDPSRLVISHSDDNGFTTLIINGQLKTNLNALEFVQISNSLQEGVYQIVEVVSPTEIVINLQYASTDDLPGATINYYYNNYQVRVKIFAGLPDSHEWSHIKPYEEVAELSLTPDENNEVMFSVADYITQKVKVVNNLTLFSLPMNLDAFTGFYISTAESYDDSDNYSLSTTLTDFADDSFEGYAIAGKLPFKNMYAGDYAEYVYTDGSPAKWLTIIDRPLAVNGLFFDISFIKNIDSAFIIRIARYVSDYAFNEDVEITNFGIGVYRIPLTIDSVYDSYCIQAIRSGFAPATLDALNLWLENGSGYEWTDTTTPQTFLVNNFDSENKYTEYVFVIGQSYTFGFEVETILSGFPVLTRSVFLIRVKDSSDNTLIEWEVDMLGDGESLPPLEEWTSRPTANSKEWTVDTAPDVVLSGADSDNIVSELLYVDYIFTPGRTYQVDVSLTLTVNSGSLSGITILQVLDAAFTPFNDFHANVAGTNTISMTFVANSDSVKFGILVSTNLGVGNITVVVNSATILTTAGQIITDSISFVAPTGASRISIAAEQTGTGSVTYRVNEFTNETETVSEVAITEEICIDIIDDCESVDQFTTDSIRQLEDGDYRLLE